MTVDLDVTELKRRGGRFYPAVLYSLAVIVNRHREFRMAFNEEGVLGWYDQLSPSYTVFHPDTESFSCLWTEYIPDLSAFLQRYEEDLRLYGSVESFEAKPHTPPNVFNVSMIPWQVFTSFHLELPRGGEYLLPIFTLGRYRAGAPADALGPAGPSRRVRRLSRLPLCRRASAASQLGKGGMTLSAISSYILYITAKTGGLFYPPVFYNILSPFTIFLQENGLFSYNSTKCSRRVVYHYPQRTRHIRAFQGWKSFGGSSISAPLREGGPALTQSPSRWPRLLGKGRGAGGQAGCHPHSPSTSRDVSQEALAICRQSLSAIMAMNSLLVGLPRVLWMV